MAERKPPWAGARVLVRAAWQLTARHRAGEITGERYRRELRAVVAAAEKALATTVGRLR